MVTMGVVEEKMKNAPQGRANDGLSVQSMGWKSTASKLYATL